MNRYRFQCNAGDPRPMTWPIPHPYWITGYSLGAEEKAVVVAYGGDEDYILKNWPDAENITSEPAPEGYQFTDRFPKPTWFTPKES